MTVGLYCFNIVTLIINGSIFMQLPLVLYRSGMGKGGVLRSMLVTLN